MKIRPCSTCETVVREILDGYEEAEYTYIETDLEEFEEEIEQRETETSVG